MNYFLRTKMVDRTEISNFLIFSAERERSPSSPTGLKTLKSFYKVSRYFILNRSKAKRAKGPEGYAEHSAIALKMRERSTKHKKKFLLGKTPLARELYS